MFNITFKYNKEKVQQLMYSRLQNTFQLLKNREDKTFSVTLNKKTYRLRYEITAQDIVDLYLISDDLDDAKLVRPTLQLNLGAFLLPESLSLDVSPKGLNPTAYNPQITELGSSYPSEAEIASLKAYITSQGIYKLLPNF